MARKTLIAGNWKMNLNLASAKILAEGIRDALSKLSSEKDILVFPSSLHLAVVSQALQGTRIAVGAQNIYPSGLSAFTGEICPAQLKDFFIENVLIGHSERRSFLGESSSFCNEKILFALEQNFTPVYCIGETLEERESGKTFSIIESQVKDGLKSLSPDQGKKIILAYEPVWAIGTGKVATPDQAQEVHAFIRQLLTQLLGKDVADSIRILYGGSVKPDNIVELLAKPDIDGGLVGGASQKLDSFLGLLQ